MKYYSLNRNSPEVSFKEAVIQGIAPDRGLYFPASLPFLKPAFLKDLHTMHPHEVALEVIRPFVGDSIPGSELRSLIKEVLSFEFPLRQLDTHLGTLELFHGPTMAFKDVGARFMARCLGYFTKDSATNVTVLVATSGDTGGAVADGFKGVEGVNVMILYPKGKVSDFQERQLCTQGKNVTAVEVDGDFDACQAMVKKAFLDTSITKELRLTSANSINVARWLPQMFYYFYAYQQAGEARNRMVVSVPSGNFGNICAGLMALKLGLPIHHMVASTNVNDTIPAFMREGHYEPKPSVPTISNAMDVGDPSNFVRILELFGGDRKQLQQHFSSYSFTDKETRSALKELHTRYNYVADPHGAVGYLGLKKYQESDPEAFGIFLETAHPIKFEHTVENTLGINLELPARVRAILELEKQKKTASTYEEVKALLLEQVRG